MKFESPDTVAKNIDRTAGEGREMICVLLVRDDEAIQRTVESIKEYGFFIEKTRSVYAEPDETSGDAIPLLLLEAAYQKMREILPFLQNRLNFFWRWELVICAG